jgi:hypothetical protein
MKALLRTVFAMALLAGATLSPAMAQDEPVVGTLHLNHGTVMTSNGGEFTTLGEDRPLHVGDRIMVSDGGSATGDFTNGVVLQYESPGVYTVALPPPATGAVASSGASTAATVGIILGTVLLTAAGIESMDDVPADRAISHN